MDRHVRIPAADNGQGGGVRYTVCNCRGPLAEGVDFEKPHGAVRRLGAVAATCCCPSGSSPCTSTASASARARWSARKGKGFRQVFHGLNPERITGAALGVGIARYALGAAARYAAERKVWAEPIGAHQGVAHPLAKAKIETELAALMIRQAAWQHDHGQPAGESSNMAKYAAAEAAIAAVDAAIQVHGGNGLASEYGLIPYWGLARLLRIAPVNREMILNYVAQHSLGLPRSY